MNRPGSERIRHAARAILLSSDDHVLLLDFQFPWRNFRTWITPGGGLEASENAHQALRRELAEETGLRVGALGPEIWRREIRLSFAAEVFRQRERYFLVRSERFEARFANPEVGDEADWFRGFRWWPVDAIPEASRSFAPTGIGAQLRELCRSGPPSPVRQLGR